MKRILATFAALALTIGGQAKAETAEQNREAIAALAANCSVNFKLSYAISEKVGRPEKFLKDLSQYFFIAAETFDKKVGSEIIATHALNMSILNGDDKIAIENLGRQIKELQEPCRNLKKELDKAAKSYE
jgi:hypothetical protein